MKNNLPEERMPNTNRFTEFFHERIERIKGTEASVPYNKIQELRQFGIRKSHKKLVI